MHTLSRRNVMRLSLLATAFAFDLGFCGLGVRRSRSGYDPVAYFTFGKPTHGLPEFEYEWDEHRYRFARAEHLELFKADPVRYAPQLRVSRRGAGPGRHRRGKPGILAAQRGQALSVRQADRTSLVPTGYCRKPRQGRTEPAAHCEPVTVSCEAARRRFPPRRGQLSGAHRGRDRGRPSSGTWCRTPSDRRLDRCGE